MICYDENKEISYILYLDANNLYGWAMSQKLPGNNLIWIKDVSEIDEDFIKTYNEDSDFESCLYKLPNNSVFGKTMENVRKHRDIKLVTTYKKRSHSVSESNYHTTKWFSENLLAIEIKKIKVNMNKPVYLDMSILEISKTLMYEF